MLRRLALIAALTLAACRPATPPPASPASAAAPATDLQARARVLAQRYLIADGHVDLPYRLHESMDAQGKLTEDVSKRTETGDFDYERAKEGGLDAPFMSIYIPAKYQGEPGRSKQEADGLIDLVEGLVTAAPDRFQIATHPDQIPAIRSAGKIALPMGMENGSAIELDLANVDHFHRRGIRYVTLTHSKDNQICDSSYDERHTHKGLSPFGRQVIERMNQVGIMVDVSHVTDDVIRQVLALSKVPVIASHSSVRHFTPGFERNLPDDLIEGIAKGGGVVLVNFGSTFVKQASRDYFSARRKAAKAFVGGGEVEWEHDDVKAFLDKYAKKNPPVLATVEDVADHIDHIVKLVGADHVGFGSDFDGVGPTLPTGLRDASQLPNLIRALLERGYSEADIEKICGLNFMRVWRAVEDFAARGRSTP